MILKTKFEVGDKAFISLKIVNCDNNQENRITYQPKQVQIVWITDTYYAVKDLETKEIHIIEKENCFKYKKDVIAHLYQIKDNPEIFLTV